jgi:hypothetical protein
VTAATATDRPVIKRAKAQLDTKAGGPGEFDMILSAGNRDRDGDVLRADQWKQPLPDHVPINVGHTSDVSSIVGSGTPFIDAKGNLRVRGKFSGTDLGQRVRQLVNEGHLRGVSVEYLKTKGANGRPVHDLVAGAFVMVPSNPAARVLSSKAANDGDDGGGPVDPAQPNPANMVRAIHDAAVWLGAQCMSDNAQEQMMNSKATAQPVRAGDDSDPDSPLGQLQQIIADLAAADPDDAADLASQAIGILQGLGGSVPDDQDDDTADNDELEAKATALRLRMKMLA